MSSEFSGRALCSSLKYLALRLCKVQCFMGENLTNSTSVDKLLLFLMYFQLKYCYFCLFFFKLLVLYDILNVYELQFPQVRVVAGQKDLIHITGLVK